MDKLLTIEKIQAGLLAKSFSAVELIDFYLTRINKFDGDLNSFITVSSEYAYTQARKIDKIVKELGSGALARYPLLGCVVSHKDIFSTKGIQTTAASKVLENYIPEFSATVVDRLDKAGCIMIGKTNCDAWAHGASGENSDFGSTKNPWNNLFVSGGSSSGSAVSVSANFSTFSTGSDTGGSIRFPSNFCGIVGFKPTYGVVPRYGVISMASSTDSIGHMARVVKDIEKIFRVTMGEDGYDSTVVRFKRKKIRESFTIGVPKEYFTYGIDNEVARCMQNVIKVYESMGVKIKQISLPHTKYAVSVYYIIQPAEVSSNLGRFDGIRFGNKRETFGSEAKRRIMLGTYVLSSGYYDAYYLKAMKVRSKIVQDFDLAFNQVDAIIAPVSPTPPFRLGEKANNPLEMYLADVFMCAASLAGIPSLAIPYGFTKKNLPLGFQLMGKRFSENTLFALSKKFENETNYKPIVPRIGKTQ